ncbi:class I SAM-dependent methyltransferase [Acinetobacter larvae]|uniref:SAM-dependent methyltransferase n=1 Tax=Acinetobacter larvae TaxID=1789224 RepID=A0A1B2LYS1_9GAMM|nr:class I SAM-dependent methyltransferase [Acinetobacter larvae]AOA58094.1 SAM-dependent methyltransferase [Acinetobacter larvae]
MKDLCFKDYFSKNAVGYALYRPSYPTDLINKLANLCSSHQRVLDCACGTGQLSVLLAERFNEVIATDASAAQIEQAESKAGVLYKVAGAEESGLADQSVDLITVAQAAHWLDLDAFYHEVQRVARPNAVIALISYGILHVDGAEDSALQQFYYQTISEYWPIERKHVEDGYQSLYFPFAEITVPPINMYAYWDLEELIGYLKTWSAVHRAQEVLGYNPVDQLQDKLRRQWGNAKTKKKITWPLTIRAGSVNII